MDRDHCLLAVEDQLSEAVASKLLEHFDITVTTVIGKKGSNYLKGRAENLNRAAKGFPVFLLTDLDSPKHCPPGIIDDWFRTGRNEGLIFRIAVMEIESWVMADREIFADFIGAARAKIPQSPDTLEKPKEFILDLVRRHGKRRLRNALLPSPESTARVGPEYNLMMAEFVSRQWDVRRASSISPSLRRAVSAIRLFKSHHEISSSQCPENSAARNG